MNHETHEILKKTENIKRKKQTCLFVFFVYFLVNKEAIYGFNTQY